MRWYGFGTGRSGYFRYIAIGPFLHVWVVDREVRQTGMQPFDKPLSPEVLTPIHDKFVEILNRAFLKWADALPTGNVSEVGFAVMPLGDTTPASMSVKKKRRRRTTRRKS